MLLWIFSMFWFLPWFLTFISLYMIPQTRQAVVYLFLHSTTINMWKRKKSRKLGFSYSFFFAVSLFLFLGYMSEHSYLSHLEFFLCTCELSKYEAKFPEFLCHSFETAHVFWGLKPKLTWMVYLIVFPSCAKMCFLHAPELSFDNSVLYSYDQNGVTTHYMTSIDHHRITYFRIPTGMHSPSSS